MAVGVTVGVGVEVAIADGVGVTAGVAVGVAVGLALGLTVGVAVAVGVGVGVLPIMICTTPVLNGLAQRLPFASKSTATTCQCVRGELLGVWLEPTP